MTVDLSAEATPRARRPGDAYYTPAWCVRRLVERVALPGGDWLDPCAGNGALVRAFARPDVRWSAVELDPAAAAQIPPDVTVDVGDYLSWRPTRPVDVVVTNPPFSLAEAFLRKALDEAPCVAFLLRLHFLAATCRADLLRARTPDVYVLPNRPAFLGNGERDNMEYGWCVWGTPGSGGRFEVLAVTPPSERRAG